MDDDEDQGPRCAATFEGSACAYSLGHSGAHWTIMDSGEVSWTEESIARRRAKLATAILALEELISELEACDAPELANEAREVRAGLLALFAPGGPASLGDEPSEVPAPDVAEFDARERSHGAKVMPSDGKGS